MGYILITGGAGFIGSHLTEALLDRDNTKKILILDNLSTGKIENIPSDNRIEFIKGDVSEEKTVHSILENYPVDTIYHLAAIADVQYSIDHPLDCHRINFDSTLYFLEKLRNVKNFKRFIFASSAAVYGNKPSLPCRETDPVNPLSPYGVDKYASEKSILNASALYGIPATAFRCFNVYGLRQNPSSPYSGVISIFIDRIIKGDGSVKIYGDGEQTRDFIYVKDLVKTILFVIQKKESAGEVYNIGTDKETSLNRLVKIIEKITGRSAHIEYLKERKGDIRHSRACIEKLTKLGFDHNFLDISEGLKEMIAGL